jgi:hypothetical protein
LHKQRSKTDAKVCFKTEAIFKGKGDADPQQLGELIANIQRGATVPLHRAMWKAAEGQPDHPLYPHYRLGLAGCRQKRIGMNSRGRSFGRSNDR